MGPDGWHDVALSPIPHLRRSQAVQLSIPGTIHAWNSSKWKVKPPGENSKTTKVLTHQGPTKVLAQGEPGSQYIPTKLLASATP